MMLTLKRNIIISILFHALVAVSVVIAGWNIIGETKNFIVVSFVEEALQSESSGEDVMPERGKDKQRASMRKKDVSHSIVDRDMQKTEVRPPSREQVEHVEDTKRPVRATQSSEAKIKNHIQQSEQTALSSPPVSTPWYGENSETESHSRSLTETGTAALKSGHMTGLHSSPAGYAGSGSTDHLNAIRKAIENAKQYPFLAKKRGIQGAVTTAFTIDQAGNPEEIRIIRSSGSMILDSAAKKTILAAAPFPRVRGNIEIRISYILKE